MRRSGVRSSSAPPNSRRKSLGHITCPGLFCFWAAPGPKRPAAAGKPQAARALPWANPAQREPSAGLPSAASSSSHDPRRWHEFLGAAAMPGHRETPVPGQPASPTANHLSSPPQPASRVKPSPGKVASDRLESEETRVDCICIYKLNHAHRLRRAGLRTST